MIIGETRAGLSFLNPEATVPLQLTRQRNITVYLKKADRKVFDESKINIVQIARH